MIKESLSPMYVQTIYDSRARAHISDQDTANAKPYNIANGLTGFLYYDDWRFLQVIEGHPVQVAEVMKRITKSPVHHSVKVRLMNRTEMRSFGGWPLGVLSASDPGLQRIIKLMGYNDLFETNVLDAVKVMKRVAGRKYRAMSIYEKEALFNVRLTEKPARRLSLTEEMLGLRG